jgi:dimethylglycine dehydrogenase
VAPHYQLRLMEAIEEADASGELGLKWYGARALLALRLEKGWGVWGADYRPDFTAAEAGLDSFIDWQRDFCGKQAALEEAKSGPAKRLCVMRLASEGVDVTGDEAVMKDQAAVGFVSSGGYAHHVGCSVALAYLPTELAVAGTQLEVEILGQFWPAEVLGQPLYDANASLLRS